MLMKKLLLFILSLLVLIPPLKALELEYTVYDRSYTGTQYPNLYNIGTTSTTLLNLTKATTSIPTALEYRGAKDGAGVTFDLITIQKNSIGTTSTLSHKGSSTVTSRYLLLAKNTRLNFSAMFGKINRVKVTFESGYNQVYFKGQDGTTFTYASNVLTLENPTGENIDFQYTNSSTKIFKIVVYLEKAEGDFPTPGTPEVAFASADAFGLHLEEPSNTIICPGFSSSTKISFPIPEGATEVYYTFNDLTVPKTIAGTTSTTAVNGTYTVCTATSGYNPNLWMKYSSRVRFKEVMPYADNVTLPRDTEGYLDGELKYVNNVPKGNNLKLKVFAYNYLSKKFSEVKEYTVHVSRLAAPSVDKQRTEAVAGQRYIEETNTVEYTGVNPQVFFNEVSSTYSTGFVYTYYTTDFTSPRTSTATRKQWTNTETQAGIRLTKGVEGKYEPAIGTLDVIALKTMVANSESGSSTYYYLDNGWDTDFEVKVVRVGVPEEPLLMPELTAVAIDGGNKLTGASIPARIGISEKVELTLGVKGQNDGLRRKLFAAKPADVVDYTTWDELTLTDDAFEVSKYDVEDQGTEAWIGVVAQRGGKFSEPLWVRVGLKGPDAPRLDIVGGAVRNDEEYDVYGQNFGTIKASFTLPEGAAFAQYAMVEHRYPAEPSEQDDIKNLTVANGKVDFSDVKIRTGRLFYRVGREISESSGKIVWSDWSNTDFKLNYAFLVKLGEKNTWPSQYSENTIVTIDEPVRVMGFYKTLQQSASAATPSYLYVVNADGVAIKVVGMQTANEDWPLPISNLTEELINKFNYVIAAGGITGWLRYNNNETDMPEIYLTDGAASGAKALYQLLSQPLADAIWSLSAAGEAAQNPADRTAIDRVNDFSRYVAVRSLKWLGANNEFEMADGSRLQLYGRFAEHPLSNYTSGLETGKLYMARGFIGLASGQLSLFPTAEILQCPGTPKLFAPNPISGEADSDGFITAQAISDEVSIRVEGNAGGESALWYTLNGGTMQRIDAGTKTFKVAMKDLTDGEKVDVKVYAELNGMKSLAPACVRLTKRAAEAVESIEKFKEAAFAGHDAGDHGKIYQITGKVLIEEMTDKYLYVRDFNDSPAQELIEGEHMRRLLILNNNLWKADVEKDNGMAAPLAVGDVISGFAIASMHDRGNLLGNATGFARTFKWQSRKTPDAVNYETIAAAPTDGFRFTGNHRMRLVKLEGVQATRTENTGDDKELYPYLYKLTLDADTRMRMDIFVRSGFAEAFAENTGFNLIGIPMLDNADNSLNDEGKYAFALMSFEGSGKLAAPAVFIDGQEPGEEETVPFTGDGTIAMTAPTTLADGSALASGTAVSIHYSIDGLDPLKNITSRHKYGEAQYASELELGDGDVEIRAFAAAPGMTPSDVVVRRFKKESRDVQFILNFLQTAQEGETYRFTGDTRVVAMGGDYMFVAGKVGHYLPVKLTDGWDGSGIKVGDMLSGFTVKYHVDESGNHIAVADGFEGTFKAEEAGSDAFSYTPDETTSLDILQHPRRLVKLKNVKASAPAAAAAALSARTIEEWTVTENANETGDGVHALRVGMLGDVKVYSLDEDGNEQSVEGLADGETYDILGFVMLNGTARDGKMEVWPLSAELLLKTDPVKAEFSAGTNHEVNAEGEIEATFEGMSLVSLSCPTKGAKIYYALGRGTTGLTWYEYQRPIAVTEDEYIHANAIAPNCVESGHTHIAMTALQQSGDIEFTPTVSDGKTVLTIAAKNATAGAHIWYSTGDDRGCGKEYKSALTFTEATVVHACVQESGKAKGAVQSIHVMVVDIPDTPEIPDVPDPATVSGAVKFTVDDSEKEETGKVYVILTPEDENVNDYKIYYSTESGETLTPETGTLYTDPIEISETTYIMAILVENGKTAGEVTAVNVWVSPKTTGIDGIGNDGDADRVRVEGDSIIAPDGSEIFDISGRRVSADGLRKGIYIVRTPDGKAVKVMI